MVMRSYTRRTLLSTTARAAGAATLVSFLGVDGAAAAQEHAARRALTGTLSIFDQNYLGTPGPQKGVVQAYEALHPGVKIQLSSAPANADPGAYVTTELSAGTAPDIILTYVPQQSWSALGHNWWLELTDFVGAPNPYDAQKRTYRQLTDLVFLDQLQLHNRFWNIGIEATESMWYYNKPLFAKAGVTPPRTWDEFMRAQGRLQKAGIVPTVVDGGDTTFGSRFAEQIPDVIQSQTMPGTIRKMHPGAGVVTVDELVAGIENGTYSARNADYQEMWRLLKDWSRYWQRGALGATFFTGSFGLWPKGSGAMTYTGNWFHPHPTDKPPVGAPQDWWDVFPFPQITPASSHFATAGDKNVGVGSISGGWGISYVAKQRGHDALARDFLHFLAAPRQAQVMTAQGFLPLYKQIPVAGDTPHITTALNKFDTVLRHPAALPFALTALGPSVQLTRVKLMQSYLSGQVSLDTAMGQMQSALERAARQAKRWLAVAQQH